MQIVDPEGPQAPWGKAYGDIDGDGLTDIVVGGHQGPRPNFVERILRKLGRNPPPSAQGELVWYRNPDWSRHVISTDFAVRTDLEVGDIDGDGRADVVLLSDTGMYWLKSPFWEPALIYTGKLHDVELADVDQDGKLDIVARSQSGFGYGDGNQVLLFRQAQQWLRTVLPAPHGEGLKVADMDGDTYPDIVVNQVWLRNPGTGDGAAGWQPQFYARDWTWEDVFIDTADFNHDGREDVVLSPSEKEGQRYQIAWFQAPGTGGEWIKHIVDGDVEAVHHFVAARDANGDGEIDVLTAEMTQGEDPDEVKLYLNEGNDHWRKTVMGDMGSHSMRAVDLDGDFDIDLFGANWQKPEYEVPYPVYLWLNQTADAALWPHYVVDAGRPGQATFVFAEDIDGDGLKDIVAGGYWYRHPQKPSAKWQRFKLGDQANNAAWLADFDGDGDIDFLASGWIGYNHRPSLIDRLLNRTGLRKFDYEQPGGRFVWGENDGHGAFSIHDNIEQASGDFLQGVGMLEEPTARKVLLSWHGAGHGVQALSVPAQPAGDIWRWSRLSEASQDEQLSTADIDRDGFADVVLGTKWLRNNGDDTWQEKIIADTPQAPDRNRVVDMNSDGRLDVVVGFEAISKKGPLVWYEQPESLADRWREHKISADVTGPMSLGVADMDGDGDADVVVGEHDLLHPQRARLIWFENSRGAGGAWKGHLIQRGEEHHDGALTVDLDGDGDLDIVSIGWSHGQVTIYENPRTAPASRHQ